MGENFRDIFEGEALVMVFMNKFITYSRMNCRRHKNYVWKRDELPQTDEWKIYSFKFITFILSLKSYIDKIFCNNNNLGKSLDICANVKVF